MDVDASYAASLGTSITLTVEESYHDDHSHPHGDEDPLDGVLSTLLVDNGEIHENHETCMASFITLSRYLHCILQS